MQVTRYIEFLGMPGVGKSTACRLLLRALRMRTVRVQLLDQAALGALLRGRRIPVFASLVSRMPRRLRLAALRLLDGSAHCQSQVFSAFRAQYPEFIDYIFEKNETRISLGCRDNQVVLLWLLRLMWWYQLATDEGTDVEFLVSEEGFSGLGLSLLAYREAPSTDVWERAVREYFRCTPEPDAVVVLLTPVEVALHQMELRQWGYPTRMRGLPPSERRAVLARAERCVDLGMEELRHRGVDVFEIENEGKVEDLRRSVEAVAQALVVSAGT